MKMEQTECSKMSAYKIHTPQNYPEESIQHSEQGESFKIKKTKIHSTATYLNFSTILENSLGLVSELGKTGAKC